MKIQVWIVAALASLVAAPSHAIVGGAAPATDGVFRSVVTIVGSRGNSCSGTLIAPDLVLSVAHCVGPGTDYKIVDYGRERLPQRRDVRAHPNFDMKTMLAHRATADVALLQVVAPKAGPSAIGVPSAPLAAGNHFTIAGIGVTERGNGRSAGTVRSADLVATGHPGTLQIRLFDPAASGTRAGLGACTGDSGGPVFEAQQGRLVVIGVVDWSTGPNGSDGCGGLTGVTPLTLYRDWIVQTAKQWGSVLAVP
jgi:secreted trypsin-like serine protease